jgi:transketolase
MVFEIDGHNIPEILSTLHLAASNRERPSVLIAHTVKGKGVPYMEGNAAWHGSVKLTRQQAEDALLALGSEPEEIKELLDV